MVETTPRQTAAPAQASANRTTLAIGLVLLSMLGFAIMDGLTKRISHTVPIIEIMWVRNVVFTLTALALIRRNNPGRKLSTFARSSRPWFQFWRALLLVTEMGMFMLAFSLLPLAEVHAINAIAPLAVVALSVPMLKEKVGPRRWAAVLVGFIGVLVIVRPGYIPLTPPVLLTLAASSMWALYQVLVRIAARSDHSDTTTLWTAVVGLLATTAALPWIWKTPDMVQMGWMLVIAAIGTFGHTALIAALGMTEPSKLQPYQYTLFVWAIVVGFLMFGHVPDEWTLVGAGIIIASGIYAWHRERVRKGEAPTSSASG